MSVASSFFPSHSHSLPSVLLSLTLSLLSCPVSGLSVSCPPSLTGLSQAQELLLSQFPIKLAFKAPQNCPKLQPPVQQCFKQSKSLLKGMVREGANKN